MSNKPKSQRKTKTTKAAMPAPIAASILDYLLPVLGGAIVTMFVLSLLKLGAGEIWSPFARGGPRLFQCLAASGLAGGIAASALGRRFSGPLAATACALGWALWGWSLHFGAQGDYLTILSGGLPEEMVAPLLFKNAVPQSFCVAFGLIIASAVSWFWARRRNDFIEQDEAPVTDDDLSGNGLKSFSTAFVYPIATVIGGVIMLMFFGLLVLPLGDPGVEDLPSGAGIALLCGALTMLGMTVATFIARRVFSALGSVGDILAAPLVIAVVAILWLTTQLPFFTPAARLIWHTSAFELASWGALGASLGFYLARTKLGLKAR